MSRIDREALIAAIKNEMCGDGCGGWEGGLTMEEWLKEAISSIKGFAARAFEECAEKADEIHVQRNWAFELFAKEFARLAKEDDR